MRRVGIDERSGSAAGPGRRQTVAMSLAPPSCRALRTAAFVVAVLLAPVADARADDASLGLVRSLFASFEPARKTSGFAVRRHPVRKHVHFHQGVDLAAPHGTA